MDHAGFDSPSRCVFEVGEQVQIIGERGTYVVVRIDHRRYAADLLLIGENHTVEFGVRLAAIRPVSPVRRQKGRIEIAPMQSSDSRDKVSSR